MRIESLYRYPVKGLSPEALEEVVLSPGETLPLDRRFAFAQGDSPFDPAAPTWMQKRHFACLMANARIAAIRSAFDASAGVLALRFPDGTQRAEPVGTAEGRAALAAAMTAFLGEEARGALRFAEAPGHAFTDTPRKAVHLVGLASVADLSARIGTPLEPLRFRANLYFSGAAPFAELDWVGQDLLVGGARLRVFKRTIRCAATEVNLATTARDADPPAALRTAFGHADLGVHAEVLEGGRIAVGDAVEVVGRG